jgi:hypothetical protein
LLVAHWRKYQAASLFFEEAGIERPQVNKATSCAAGPSGNAA